MQGVVQAETQVKDAPPGVRAADSRPAAVVQGRPIPWSDVVPLLSEAAGAAIIEELAIDSMASRELQSRGLSIHQADVDAEEALLTGAVARTGATAAQTAELLMQMRRSRGLGPERYRALLNRNAILRALVRDECEPTDEQVSQGLDVRYGPRYVCRIIVTGSQQEASGLHSRLSAVPEDARTAAFAAEAFRTSVDPSKERGGLLEPISPSDASYAGGVRRAAAALEKGKLSPIIALDNGYAILLGEEVIAAQPAPPDASRRVRAEIRTRLERGAMDQLARRLLMSAPPTLFDPSLHWSWENRR